MGDVEDAYIGAAAGAALFDHVGGGVEGPDEAHRAGGYAAGVPDDVAFVAESAEAESGAPAGFVDHGSV